MALQWLTTFWLAVYTIGANKQRATTESIDELNKRIDEKCARISKLEGELKAQPTRDELVRIHHRIDEEMKGMRLELSKVNERLDKIMQKSNEYNEETNLLLGKLFGKLDNKI